MKSLLALIFIAITITNIKGTCPEGCNLPITIYNDLKCRPLYTSPSECCPIEYDCSHIFNRSENTCHFKGKLYKTREHIKDEDMPGSCDRECACQEGSKFFCPPLMDGCAEDWVGGYPEPGCYLRYELNSCCADGQICPPFKNLTKCKVNEKIYKEGELFDHPKQKCTKCACKKGFDGKLEQPFCEEVQCYAEINKSDAINDNCAPFYNSRDSCCPDKWVCPSKTGTFLASLTKHVNQDILICKFGTGKVRIGERYEENSDGEKVYCECVVPPLMTCGPQPFKI